MALSTHCAACLLRKQLDMLDKCTASEAAKQSYLRQICMLLAETAPQDTAPTVLYRMDEAHRKLLGPLPDVTAQKQHFNALMMTQLPAMQQQALLAGREGLYRALQYAIAGNYIDFGAPQTVEVQRLQQLLNDAPSLQLDKAEYNSFVKELSSASQLVYLTDNCGEIVADRLLIEQIRSAWPQLRITVIVRGGQTVNDATLEDAEETGLDDLVSVLPSGCALAGTEPRLMNAPAREALLAADVILSKGQGNFETLAESDLPVYFAFLCKCSWFTKRFDLPLYQPVFIARERLTINTF